MIDSEKIVGVGLNKTGTKTLGRYLKGWGYRHKTYDLDAFNLYRSGDVERVLELMDDYDSFEDWPWPLLYREIDAKYPAARFVLTVRKSPDVWFRSLCNMAVRMGPLNDYEKHIYGHAMPQGKRDEHVSYYHHHNEAVQQHFADRPDKLLVLCWEDGGGAVKLARFLGKEIVATDDLHANKSSSRIYTGDNIVIAHANRLAYQAIWRVKRYSRRVLRGLRRRIMMHD